MKKQTKLGDIVSIKLSDNSFTFARSLKSALYAFYNFQSKTDDLELEEIVKKPIAFVLPVMSNALTKNNWAVIGNLPLEEDLETYDYKFFKQDLINKEKIWIMDLSGNQIEASRKEVLGLERAAVWEAEHIEDRLEDLYQGKKNKWVESLELK